MNQYGEKIIRLPHSAAATALHRSVLHTQIPSGWNKERGENRERETHDRNAQKKAARKEGGKVVWRTIPG